MRNAARDKRQTSAKRRQFLAVFVRILQEKIIGLFERLARYDIFASSRRRACDDLTKITPVPVAELSSSFRPSDNGGSYERSAETCIVGPAWIRTEVSNASKLTVAPPPFGVASLDQVIVCGEGIIWKKTSTGMYAVAETLTNAVTDLSVLPLKRSDDNALHVNGNVGRRKLSTRHTYAFLRQVADSNYGHWITEVLPKVAILAEHFDIKSLKFIVTEPRHFMMRPSGPMRKVFVNSLAEFGIRPYQILPMARESVEVERLLYPLPLAVHPWVKAPRTIQILEGLRDKIANGQRGPRRIYASRVGAIKRHLLNEAEILRILRAFDVTVVHPERLSFVDQVRLFADAELVIGNCGANLTDAVFSPRGVKIFAITSETMRDDFFWDLANLKSGKYFSLHGRATCSNPDMNSDFLVNPDEFRAFLEERVLKDH